MNKIFVFILGLLFISCGNVKSQSSGNTLTAEVENITEGTNVFISEYGEGNKVVALDTLQIENEKFVFDFPKRDYQTLGSIRVEGVTGLVYFINEAEPMKITLLKDEENFLANEPEIEAGEANTLFVEYVVFTNEVENRVHQMTHEYSVEELKDPKTQDILREAEKRALEDLTTYRREAIEKHPDALSSAYILADLLSSRAVSPEKLEAAFYSLSEEIQNSFIGQELAHAIVPPKGVEVGDEAPIFKAKNPEGKEISLQDILDKDGKYTLIEFWASWCPNCHEEMPNVVEIYKDYHHKGLNIIGVSIDNDEKEWKYAIEDFGMEWEQVSNLNHWQDQIVREYGVTSIPYTFLLDENGKVIAKKLKGEELREKIEELLD